LGKPARCPDRTTKKGGGPARKRGVGDAGPGKAGPGGKVVAPCRNPPTAWKYSVEQSRGERGGGFQDQKISKLPNQAQGKTKMGQRGGGIRPREVTDSTAATTRRGLRGRVQPAQRPLVEKPSAIPVLQKWGKTVSASQLSHGQCTIGIRCKNPTPPTPTPKRGGQRKTGRRYQKGRRAKLSGYRGPGNLWKKKSRYRTGREKRVGPQASPRRAKTV